MINFGKVVSCIRRDTGAGADCAIQRGNGCGNAADLGVKNNTQRQPKTKMTAGSENALTSDRNSVYPEQASHLSGLEL